MKRNEICAQIENWIEELCKPQYNERSSRTISFNSMVLRRQYRHLREELAKLKVPEGLSDLDAPFNPNVTLPAMNDSSTNNVNTSGTVSTTKSNSEATTGSSNVATTAPSCSINVPTETSQTSGNVSSESNVHQENNNVQSLNTSPMAPLEINTNQNFIICNIAGDDNDDSPTILPQTKLPPAVKAKLVNVDESSPSNDTEGAEGDEEGGDADVIATGGEELEVSEYKCNTVDELMEPLYFESSENAMHYDD